MAKQTDKYIEFLFKTVEELQKDHSLTDYTITIVEHKKEGGKFAAKINVDSEYYRIKIEVWPVVREDFEHGDLETVRDYMAHELAHIRTDALVQLALSPYKTEQELDRENERLTEVLGRLMYYKTYGETKQPRSTHPSHLRPPKRKPRRIRKQSVRSGKPKGA